MTRPLARFDAWQRRHAAAALPIAVARKFLDDRAARALSGALLPADRRALDENVRAARRNPRQRIAVTFDEGGAHHYGTPDGPIVAAAGRTDDAPTPSYDREPPP